MWEKSVRSVNSVFAEQQNSHLKYENGVSQKNNSKRNPALKTVFNLILQQ